MPFIPKQNLHGWGSFCCLCGCRVTFEGFDGGHVQVVRPHPGLEKPGFALWRTQENGTLTD